MTSSCMARVNNTWTHWSMPLRSTAKMPESKDSLIASCKTSAGVCPLWLAWLVNACLGLTNDSPVLSHFNRHVLHSLLVCGVCIHTWATTTVTISTIVYNISTLFLCRAELHRFKLHQETHTYTQSLGYSKRVNGKPTFPNANNTSQVHTSFWCAVGVHRSTQYVETQKTSIEDILHRKGHARERRTC